MSRNDDIMNKPDSRDIVVYNDLVKKALIARRKIETGFLFVCRPNLMSHFAISSFPAEQIASRSLSWARRRIRNDLY